MAIDSGPASVTTTHAAGVPQSSAGQQAHRSGMTESQSIAKLAAALAAAQADMPAAPRDAANPHFRSRYADLASVWEAWRSAGPRHGLAVIQRVGGFDGRSVTVRSRLAHASGEWIETETVIPVSKGDAQGVGSAITYARRYALAALVGVVPDDDDGEAAVGRPVPQATPMPSSPTARQPALAQTAASQADDGRERAQAWVAGYLARINAAADLSSLEAAHHEAEKPLKRLKVAHPDLYQTARDATVARARAIEPDVNILEEGDAQ